MSEAAAQQGCTSGRGLPNKRDLSNRKRLQALRRRSVQCKVGLPQPTGKHTVFDSDDSIEDCKEDVIPLFAESDSSSSSDEDHRFSQHRSKKMMDLQRKIGLDQRFRLDDRFAASDSDDEGNENCISVNEIETEKQQALQILNSMVSSSGATKFKEAVLQQVYDPESDQAEPSTLVALTSDSENKTSQMTDEHSSFTLNTPVVSNERFHSVHQDLKSGLTGEPFSFEFVEDGHQETKQSPQPEQSIHSSEAHHSMSMMEWDAIESPKQKTGGDQYHLLFFHWDHPTLQNRRAEGSFCREKSAEELMSGWDSRRTSVKTQYKRARKNALRKKSQHKH